MTAAQILWCVLNFPQFLVLVIVYEVRIQFGTNLLTRSCQTRRTWLRLEPPNTIFIKILAQSFFHMLKILFHLLYNRVLEAWLEVSILLRRTKIRFSPFVRLIWILFFSYEFFASVCKKKLLWFGSCSNFFLNWDHGSKCNFDRTLV